MGVLERSYVSTAVTSNLLLTQLRTRQDLKSLLIVSVFLASNKTPCLVRDNEVIVRR